MRVGNRSGLDYRSFTMFLSWVHLDAACEKNVLNGPWKIWMKFQISKFQANFSD